MVMKQNRKFSISIYGEKDCEKVSINYIRNIGGRRKQNGSTTIKQRQSSSYSKIPLPLMIKILSRYDYIMIEVLKEEQIQKYIYNALLCQSPCQCCPK